MIGENTKDIVGYFEAREGNEILKMVLCLLGSAIGGFFIYYGIKGNERRDR